MKTRIIILIQSLFIFSVALTCCRQVSDNNRIRKAADMNIKISSPDTVLKGEELLAKVYLSNRDYRLIFAHVSCSVTDSSVVDSTLTGEIKIKGCNDNLMLVNDTVKIYFEPDVLGKHSFQEITLLAKGRDNGYYSQSCTFSYVVR